MFKNKKGRLIAIIVIIAILIVVAIIIFASSGNDSSSSQSGQALTVKGEKDQNVISFPNNEKVIEITSSGFSPSNLDINAGDEVIWINKDEVDHWPASAMHPTHTIYPGVNYEELGSYQGLKGCKSEGVAKDGAFDTCEPLSPGESWTFTFNQKGSWNYHDHIVSGKFGKITVN